MRHPRELHNLYKYVTTKNRNHLTYNPDLLRRWNNIIKENRYDLFTTHDGYQIIVNGYGHFKKIILNDSGREYSAKTIYEKLLKLLS